jgi:hypothetical protein
MGALSKALAHALGMSPPYNFRQPAPACVCYRTYRTTSLVRALRYESVFASLAYHKVRTMNFRLRLVALFAILAILVGCASQLPLSGSSAPMATSANELMQPEANDAFRTDRGLPCNVTANCSCC